jgi:hypothetical protein
MTVYTPDDADSERAVARLAAGEELTARFPCFDSHDPERMELALTR